ncbi:methionyl-tRNA formyltransferase-like protein [Lasiosphaeria hispida]|uniref:methionyl-tRNA formyltransferase n=1 Tax=Lasiosphaeria hispida TaxID=260671 RepID=A0AAJ0MHJ0_9PEZI|nr:methionyl-tRNA formyltransferase-like protein [Lasiosphaeria hispida]
MPVLRRLVVSSFLRPTTRYPQRPAAFYSTQRKVSDPLRILFCGSDEYSCASLKALYAEHKANQALIKSIDVLVRPAKPTGRGLKKLREVPVVQLARELQLPIHEKEGFINPNWNLPQHDGEPINLIIAVSFGLFISPRVIRDAKYGGLNLHPSLLPDLKGPAPLHHALLNRRTHTGISLQTLSERSYDAGTVLAQTPLPGIPIPASCTLAELHAMVTEPSAEMLVAGLRAGVHVPPHADVGWAQADPPAKDTLVHAPKLTSEDRQIVWSSMSAADAALRERATGALWTNVVSQEERQFGDKKSLHRQPIVRVAFEGVSEASEEESALFEATAQDLREVPKDFTPFIEDPNYRMVAFMQIPKPPQFMGAPKLLKTDRYKGPFVSSFVESTNMTPVFLMPDMSILIRMPQGGYLKVAKMKGAGHQVAHPAARFVAKIGARMCRISPNRKNWE